MARTCTPSAADLAASRERRERVRREAFGLPLDTPDHVVAFFEEQHERTRRAVMGESPPAPTPLTLPACASCGDPVTFGRPCPARRTESRWHRESLRCEARSVDGGGAVG